MASTAASAQGHTESAAATGTTSGTPATTSQTPVAAGTPAASADAQAVTPAATPASQPAADTGSATGSGQTDSGTTDGNTAAAATPASKVPAKYDLQIPPASAALIDGAVVAYLEKAARAAGWSNEDAQAALNEHLATVTAQSEGYRAATSADATYGRDHLPETLRLVNQAINRIRPEGHARRDGFLTFLGRGGAGNHLEVVSFLADLGKLMGEDAPVHSGSGSSRRSAEQVLYGTTPTN